MEESDKPSSVKTPRFGGSSHDRKVLRRAWERAIGTPIDTAPPPDKDSGPTRTENHQKEKHPLIRYTRSTGLVSIVIGIGVGLISSLFWVAIAAVYFGLAVLLIDLFIEEKFTSGAQDGSLPLHTGDNVGIHKIHRPMEGPGGHLL